MLSMVMFIMDEERFNIFVFMAAFNLLAPAKFQQ